MVPALPGTATIYSKCTVHTNSIYSTLKSTYSTQIAQYKQYILQSRCRAPLQGSSNKCFIAHTKQYIQQILFNTYSTYCTANTVILYNTYSKCYSANSVYTVILYIKCTLYFTYCTINTAQYRLYSTYCTIHTAHNVQHYLSTYLKYIQHILYSTYMQYILHRKYSRYKRRI